MMNQPSQSELAELEQVLTRLAAGHARLADLLSLQQAAMRKADRGALGPANERIEQEAGVIAALEHRRRDLCRVLARKLLPGSGQEAPRLTELLSHVDGPGGRQLRAAADELRRQMQRVGSLVRVNQSVAGRLWAFCGQFLGQLATLGRRTGCYDPSGRLAGARQSFIQPSFSAVG